MNFDYAVHSDFLIHWTGKDIDRIYDEQWHQSDKSKTSKNCDVTQRYLDRLYNILRFGIWMTEENEPPLCFDGTTIFVPNTPKTCFTELKLSESRKHAKQYGRLGIGVKRPFVINRFGRPVVYYGFAKNSSNDIFLKQCSIELNKTDNTLLNFFKPMNSNVREITYDFYSESEWRILKNKELLNMNFIIDPNPRDTKNTKEHDYFQTRTPDEQANLKYLIPLTGWFAMIIYPSLDVKNEAQKDRKYIEVIRDIKNSVLNSLDGVRNDEALNWPIEVALDDCRNF
jgi:hypothetical protein